MLSSASPTPSSARAAPAGCQVFPFQGLSCWPLGGRHRSRIQSSEVSDLVPCLWWHQLWDRVGVAGQQVGTGGPWEMQWVLEVKLAQRRENESLMGSVY